MLPPDRWQVGVVLAVGILAVSTAAILVRLTNQEALAVNSTTQAGFSLMIAASRMGLAAIVLLPNWRRFWRQPFNAIAFRSAALAGVTLAIHFATWITSLSYTSIAASTALVTTNPVWVSLLSWVWLGERTSRQTWVGVAVALAGGMLIGWGGDASPSGSNPLLGNGLALAGAWAASVYFLLGRDAQRHGFCIAQYVTIAYTVAAIVLLPLPLLVGTPYTGYSPQTYLYLLLMALLPQLVGHTSLNWSVRWLSPTLVSLVILFEPVLSSLLGYLIFKELPTAMVIGGAIVLLAGVAIVALASREKAR